MTAAKPYVEYDEILDEQLRDPETAVLYLNEALTQHDEPRLFLMALRNVARAYGMSDIAKRTSRNRVSLYRSLSKRGNPQFDCILAVLDALGLKLAIAAQQKRGSKSTSRGKIAA